MPTPQAVHEETEQARLAMRKDCIVQLYILSACYGAVSFVESVKLVELTDTLFDTLFSVLAAVLMTHWAITDARIRNRGLLRVVQEMYFFLWPVATPLYLIHTRGWRGVRLFILHVGGLFLTMCLAGILAIVLWNYFE